MWTKSRLNLSIHNLMPVCKIYYNIKKGTVFNLVNSKFLCIWKGVPIGTMLNLLLLDSFFDKMFCWQINLINKRSRLNFLDFLCQISSISLISFFVVYPSAFPDDHLMVTVVRLFNIKIFHCWILFSGQTRHYRIQNNQWVAITCDIIFSCFVFHPQVHLPFLCIIPLI